MEGVGMTDVETNDAERPGIGRRTLIKRAAAAGAVAWTAPLIIDSLASPAAAVTCATTCFRVTFPADNTPPCNAPSVAVAGDCPTGTTGAGCTTTTNLNAGTTYGAVCMSSSTQCAATTTTVTYTLNQTNATCFTAGTCAPTRRFLGARAQTAAGGCINGTISATGNSVTFTLPAGQSWANFTFVIGCSCT
jgi:hypothetical protein